MIQPEHVVIIGATSAIAEHAARLWLKGGTRRLTLIARDTGKLERTCLDLRARFVEADIQSKICDLSDIAQIARMQDELSAIGRIDTVLIAHGALPDQKACQNDMALNFQALTVNAMSPAIIAEYFANLLERQGGGTLAIIGSVAGDRARKSNYIYGSAKGMVGLYASGLQHRFARTGVRVVLVKPGPTDTPMTEHLKAKGARLAPVEEVARLLVDGANSGKPVIYAPSRWRYIMLVIRHLPRFIFDRIDI